MINLMSSTHDPLNKLKCTQILFSALVVMKSIMPEAGYAAEAREVYSIVKSNGNDFEAEKISYSKRLAELEEDMKSKRSAPKKVKMEVIKPEPVKKSVFFGTGLMSPKSKMYRFEVVLTDLNVLTDLPISSASTPAASSSSSSA